MAALVERRVEAGSKQATTTGVASGGHVEVGAQVQALGTVLPRYGLVLVIAWTGAVKFTASEAEGIRPLVENSPLMSWAYSIWSIQGFSNLLGTAEITMVVLIVLRPVSVRPAATGRGLAVLTVSYDPKLCGFSPGLGVKFGGFPAVSMVGGFLLKDIVLLGAAVWLLGDALKSVSINL